MKVLGKLNNLFFLLNKILKKGLIFFCMFVLSFFIFLNWRF